MKKLNLMAIIIATTTLLLCSCSEKEDFRYCDIRYDASTGEHIECFDPYAAQAFLELTKDANGDTIYRFRISPIKQKAPQISMRSKFPDQTHFEGEEVTEMYAPLWIYTHNVEFISGTVDLINIEDEQLNKDKEQYLEGTFNGKLQRTCIQDSSVDTVDIMNGYFKVAIAERNDVIQ